MFKKLLLGLMLSSAIMQSASAFDRGTAALVLSIPLGAFAYEAFREYKKCQQTSVSLLRDGRAVGLLIMAGYIYGDLQTYQEDDAFHPLDRTYVFECTRYTWSKGSETKRFQCIDGGLEANRFVIERVEAFLKGKEPQAESYLHLSA